MAVTKDKTTSGNTGSATTTVAATAFTPAAGSNRLLLAFVVSFQSVTALTISGVADDINGAWTYVNNTALGARGVDCYYIKTVSTSSTTVTATATANNDRDFGIIVYSLAGVDQTTPVDSYTAQTGSGVNTLTVSSATDDYIIAGSICNGDPLPMITGVQDVTFTLNGVFSGFSIAGASPNATIEWTNLNRVTAGVNVNAAAASSGNPHYYYAQQ